METRPKKLFKNEQRSKDAAAKKRPKTSGVGKINNYYEDIYISLHALLIIAQAAATRILKMVN